MKKIIIIVSIVLAVLLVGTGYFLFSLSNYGPKFEEVKQLLEPRIFIKAAEKVMVVEATGDPNKTAGPAFSLLFNTYFKLKDKPKGKAMEAPRARWPKPLMMLKNEWVVGIYALPVPSAVTDLPVVKSKEGLRVELREWQYGEVAEILHVGPYNREEETVEKLKRFITQSKYEICGDHEEEYLKGPGLLPTNPEKYLTIIRYLVRKANNSQPSRRGC